MKPQALSRAHLVLGLAAVAAFLGTGGLLRAALPDDLASGELARLGARATHTYLLLAALLNVALAWATSAEGARWRLRCAALGSWLVLAAPPVLLFAFLVEPGSPSITRPWSHVGVLLAFLGTALHALARWRVRSAGAEAG